MIAKPLDLKEKKAYCNHFHYFYLLAQLRLYKLSMQVHVHAPINYGSPLKLLIYLSKAALQITPSRIFPDLRF